MRFGSGSRFRDSPMTFTALIVVFALAGVLLLFAAVRRFRAAQGARRHCSRRHCARARCCSRVCAVLLAANLRTYQRLSL